MKRVINCKKTWLPHFWKTKKSGLKNIANSVVSGHVNTVEGFCLLLTLRNFCKPTELLTSLNILLARRFNHKHEVNMRDTFMYAPTFLPALLLCLFMTARGLFPLALASVNCSENLLPNLMLLLQPDQVQPLFVTPLCERSQSQLSVFPALHEAVTAWATPAAVMACRYADSRLAERAINKDNHLNWKKWENFQQ